MKHIFVFFAICLLVLSLFATAQVPNKISYQGLLTKSNGTPVPDGGYTIQFGLYDSLVGGNMLWTEIHLSVPTQSGAYSVLLGSITQLPGIFFQPLFVQVTVTSGPNIGGVTYPISFSPRSELTSAPYALRADTASYAMAAGSTGGVAGGDLTGTFPNPMIAANAITSLKILDGVIQRGDVQSAFKSPYADTADYAKAAAPSGNAGGDLTGTYPNPTIANNVVTSPKILDGTIQRADVQLTFKAPYADTADYAKNAPSGTQSGWMDDASVVQLTDISDSVGIGTTNPQARLHVSTGNSNATIDANWPTDLVLESSVHHNLKFLTPDGLSAGIQWNSNTKPYAGQIRYYHDLDLLSLTCPPKSEPKIS